MKPAALSPEARELLELGSFVAPPTAEQDERMDRALARLIALDRAAAPATRLGPSGAPRARGPSRRAPRLSQVLQGSSKLWLALGALAATAGASFWVGRASVPGSALSSRATSALEMPARAPVSASMLPPQLPVHAVDFARAEGAAPAQLPSEPSRVAGSPPTAPDDTGPLASTAAELTASAPPTPLDEGADGPGTPRAKRASLPEAAPALGLSAEIQRLARAEAALRRGLARQALIELEPPAARLLEQAAALRAIAECTLDRAPGAPRARETLLRWPASAFAPRIREACGL
jgi:hypothetical protein